jgi:glutamine amidotransferase
VVLDYGIGNLASAAKALRHLGARAELVTEPERAAGADGVVLPGVGAFGACARALARTGLDAVARRAVDRGVPFFGICVGFQLLYQSSEESPGAEGLGVFAGAVRRLSDTVKRPQMQWNRVRPRPKTDPAMLAGLEPEPWLYFVHSFAPPVGPETVAVCDYGGEVAAAAERGPLWGAQFHPEKSGAAGLALLANFVAACRDRVPAGA